MTASLANALWGLGVRGRNLLKRVGLLGPVESILAYLGPRLMPPPSKEATVVLPGGLSMLVPPGSPSYRNYATGLYERDVTIFVSNFVREGMTVADIGANIGYYTLLASKFTGSKGKVFAFEPDLEAYAYLQRNIAANACRNALAVNMAVASKIGSTSFVRSQVERGFISDRPGAASTSVQTVTLDSFFEAHHWPAVDLIKMDIEGGEPSALEGMTELSRRNPQMQLVLEFSLANLQRAGATPEALAAILSKLGFASGYIIEQGMKQFSLARDFPRTHAVVNLLVKRD